MHIEIDDHDLADFRVLSAANNTRSTQGIKNCWFTGHVQHPHRHCSTDRSPETLHQAPHLTSDSVQHTHKETHTCSAHMVTWRPHTAESIAHSSTHHLKPIGVSC